jgi:hypothetical protein
MPIIKSNLLIVYVEIVADYCENHMKHKYNAKAKCSDLDAAVQVHNYTGGL